MQTFLTPLTSSPDLTWHRRFRLGFRHYFIYSRVTCCFKTIHDQYPLCLYKHLKNYMQARVMINCIMDHYLVINIIVLINKKQNIFIQIIRMYITERQHK